jgi:hypothetical protein
MILNEQKELYALIEKYPNSDQEINIADGLVDLLHPPEPEAPKNEDDDY